MLWVWLLAMSISTCCSYFFSVRYQWVWPVVIWVLYSWKHLGIHRGPTSMLCHLCQTVLMIVGIVSSALYYTFIMLMDLCLYLLNVVIKSSFDIYIMLIELIIIKSVVVMLPLWPKWPSLLLMATFIVNWHSF